jgi:hypothetical protein
MKRTFFALLAATFILGGCGSMTTVDDYRPTTEPIYIGASEKVAILGRRDAGHYVTDRGFIECLVGRMENSEFQVMPEEEFVDALFPWFEPRTAPKNLTRLRKIMQEPSVRKKIDEQQISYLVWLDGEVESHGVTGAMHCGVGPTGAGCFGFTSWDKQVMFEAIVWNMVDLTEEARIRVDSEGTSYVIGLVAPIPLLTRAESQACQGMGDQLKSYFAQETE